SVSSVSTSFSTGITNEYTGVEPTALAGAGSPIIARSYFPRGPDHLGAAAHAGAWPPAGEVAARALPWPAARCAASYSMVFSSIEFLFFFLPITLGLYFVAPKRARNTILLVASLLFYTWG